MSVELAPDDIVVGMKVTILSWRPREVASFGGPFGLYATGTRTTQDHSWVGEPMTVVCVDLPFVVLAGDCFYSMEKKFFDIRQVSLMAITDEYFDQTTKGTREP